MHRLLQRDTANEPRGGAHGRLLRSLQVQVGCSRPGTRQRQHVAQSHAAPPGIAHRPEAPLHSGDSRPEHPAAVPRTLEHRLDRHLGEPLEVGDPQGERLLDQATQLEPPRLRVHLGDVEVVAQVEALERRDARGEGGANRLVVGWPHGERYQRTTFRGEREARRLQPPRGGGDAHRRGP